MPENQPIKKTQAMDTASGTSRIVYFVALEEDERVALLAAAKNMSYFALRFRYEKFNLEALRRAIDVLSGIADGEPLGDVENPTPEGDRP